MEEKTTLIFKGKMGEFDSWLEVMREKYPNSFIEIILENFNTTE